MNLSGPARAAIAGGVAAVAFLGVGGAVMAFGGGDSSPSTPTTTSQEVRPMADTDPTTSTEPATTVAPETTPPQPGFEGYTPGDDLPAPPPPPVGDAPVQTVPGPYGPIYPDGYVDPNVPLVTAPPPNTVLPRPAS